MRGAHVNALFSFCVNPSVKNAQAFERAGVEFIDENGGGQLPVATRCIGLTS
jgi:hypothetical protein